MRHLSATQGRSAARGLGLAVIFAISCLACGNETQQKPSPASSPTSISDSSVWKQEPDANGAWVAAFFLPDEAGDSCGEGQTPQRRWTRFSDEGSSPTGEEGLRLAYGTVFGAKVAGLSNPLERVPLHLISANERDGDVYLDFGPGIGETSRFGTCGASAMGATFLATFHHYYPTARSLCITIEGKAPEETETSIFHDSVACPYWEEPTP